MPGNKLTLSVYFLFFSILFIMLSESGPAAPDAALRRPAKNRQHGLEFVKDTVDAGYCSVNERKNIAVYVHNFEDTAVYVRQFVSSCGCIVTDTGSYLVGPKSTKKIEVQFRPEEDSAGVVYKSVFIRTNETADPIKYVILKAVIQPVL